MQENLSKLPKQSAQDRIMEWDSGSSTPATIPSSPGLRRGASLFPPEDDYEQRVNNANSSHVPLNLSAWPQRIINPFQRKPSRNEATPWEEVDPPTLGRLGQSWSMKLDKIKGKGPQKDESPKHRNSRS